MRDLLEKIYLIENRIDEVSLDDMSKDREFAYTFKQYVRGNANKDQVAELLRGRGNMEDFADEIHRKGVEYGGVKGAKIKELADYIRKDSNIFDLPGKALDKVKKFVGVKKESAAEEWLEETYHGNDFYEAYGELWYNEDEELDEAEYQGRKVKLGKPVRSTDGPKKFHVYVKNPKGNIVKVNFGDPNMKIKKSNPNRRKGFRARHNCDNPGPRHKARFWSCRKW